MLAGEPPQRSPAGAAPTLAGADALSSLKPFDRAAVERSRDLLERIDGLTRAMFVTVADIGGFATTMDIQGPGPARVWGIDPDRLAYAVRAFVTVWIILLACIYVPDFPMPPGVIPVAAAIGIQRAVMPQMPIRELVVPVLGSVAEPQSYSFLFVVSFGLMASLAMLAAWLATWFPISFEPDRMVFKQLGRFLRGCDRLVVPGQPDSGRLLGRLRRRLALFEVDTLPGKVRHWFAALPEAAYGEGTPQQVQDLADALQVLGDRMGELVAARDGAQSAVLVQALAPDMHAWRLGIQEVLRELPAGSVAAAEIGHMYRLLSAYRGVSEALVALVGLAALIDWDRLRETRF
jgi:hypothetical protein